MARGLFRHPPYVPQPRPVVQPPADAPAVSALTAFSVNTEDELQAVPTQDDTPQAWSVGPPLNAVQQQAFYPADDDGVVQASSAVDDSIQAWAVQPPLNAVADQSWNLDDGERFVGSQVVPDTTELVAGYVPPTVQAWAVEGGEVQPQPVDDPSVQSWAVGPPQNAVAQSAWTDDTGEQFVPSQFVADDTPPAYGTPPLNAAAAQAFNTPDEASAVTVEDPTQQTYAVQPPAVTAVTQLSAFTVDTEDEVQSAPTADDTPQAWSVGPPQNAVIAQAFNTPDEARAEPVDDPSVQSWAVQPPAVTTVTALTAFSVDTEDEVQAPTTQDDTPQSWSITPPQNAVAALVFNQPQDEPYTTVEDPTVPTYAIQPPPYVPVFQVTAWPVDGGEVKSAPTPDDSVQSWAVGTPQNAIALVAFNGDSEVTQAAPVDDPSAQTWPVQPLFDPSTVTWTGRDDIVQPVWAIADDSAQAWTIVPPVPFIGNIADESVIPAWMIPDDTTLGAWAATNGAATVVTGGPGPNSGGATASVPSASAFVPVPGGSAISPVPSGSASSPTPQR